jgi:hypothetical protein
MLMRAYDIITRVFRRPQYNYLASQVDHHDINNLSLLKNELKKIKVTPGQCIFFWHKKVKCVDHVAVVPTQDKNKLNLLEAKIVQGTPPPIGDGDDFSGIRTSTALDFIGDLNSTYSRVIIASPPSATAQQLKKAGDLAREIGSSQKIDNKIILYALPFVSKLFYTRWFNYHSHLKFKLGNPYSLAKRKTGLYTSWTYTYCGDFVGRIYHLAGVKDLPKANFLHKKFYRSSTFYEWMKANDKIESMILWNDPTPKKY